MKLRRLDIRHLTGIDRSFVLEDFSDGLNLIIGPNGIGKSRLCAAVRALLWHSRGVKDGDLEASAVFEHQSKSWRSHRDGSAHGWQCNGTEVDPPSLPGERLDGCFFLGLRDLLDDSDRAGQDLASEIRRQMSGGFDLDAAKLHFEKSVLVRAGSKESHALSEAEKKIRIASSRQAGIAAQAQEIDSLNSRAVEAKQALQRLTHYDTAIGLKQLQADDTNCQEALRAFPEALANFDGQEIERLNALEARLASSHANMVQANRELAENQAAAQGTQLSDPIDASVLTTWHERTEKLAEVERRLEIANEDACAANEAVLKQRRVLGERPEMVSGDGLDGEAKAAHALDLDEDFELFAFLRESQQLEAKMEAQLARLQALDVPEISATDAQRLAALQQALEPLRSWLRAVGAESVASDVTLWPSRAISIVTGLVMLAIGVGVHFASQTSALVSLSDGVAGVGIGLMVLGLLVRMRSGKTAVTDWRAVAVAQFPKDLEPPAPWTIDTVSTHLGEIEDQLVKLATDDKRAQDRATERKPIEAAIAELKERNTKLDVRRAKLAYRLGFKTLRPDAELVDTARALDALRAASTTASGIVAKRDVLVSRWHELIDKVSSFLVAYGEAAPTDAAAASAAVQSLEKRDQTYRSAITNSARAENNLKLLDRDLKGVEAEKSKLFLIAGVNTEDRGELQRRLEQRTRYLELIRERDEINSRIKHAMEKLRTAGEDVLIQSEVGQLSEQKAHLEESSNDLAQVNQQIGKISVLEQSAREGHELEDAIAQRSLVLGQLRERRDEKFAAVAGTFLLERVRREYETQQMPRVLERARKRFAVFTHQRYELNVSPREGGAFYAVDNKTGAALSPDRLSDGTRAQLILAARLAFAEEAEQGVKLPLFLDEALDHSDPERFHAIARSLARMVADEGRQVFYLSNDSTDAQRFQRAFSAEGSGQIKIIDLGEILEQAASISGPEALQVEPLPEVPVPAQHSPESYGEALGVARFDPARAAASQDLFYALRDDLQLLYKLLQLHIVTVGQCRNLLRGGGAFAKQVSTASEVGGQLVERFDLLEIFCLAWREGRGARIGRMEIEDSDAVSKHYLNAVIAIAAEKNGDARQLISALRERSDERLERYQNKSTDKLERYFNDKGFIDERPILDENTIFARLIGAPAANKLTPVIVKGLVHQWWSLWQ